MTTHWYPIGGAREALWHERITKKGWSLRTTAVVLGDTGLALVAPTRGLGEDVHRELRELGEPAFLAAPNHFHHIGLCEHAERYPEARVVAGESARARVERQTGLAISGLDDLESRLPDAVSLLVPPGLKTGEFWLRIETPRGLAWVVADAFFHCKTTPSGLFGIGCRITGTTPGLRIGRTFTSLAVANRDAYRRWLIEAIESDAPRILVPAHGEIIEDDSLPERLSALVHKRL